MELPAHRRRKQGAAHAAVLIATVLASAALAATLQGFIPRYGLPVERRTLPARNSAFRPAPTRIQRRTAARGLSTDWVRMTDEDLADRIRAMEHRKSKLDEQQIQRAKDAIQEGIVPLGKAVPQAGNTADPEVCKHAKLLNDLAGAELEIARRLFVKQQSKALIREQKNRERRMRRMKEKPSLLAQPAAATSVATVQAQSVGQVPTPNMPTEIVGENSQTGLWRAGDRVLFSWNQTVAELRIRVNLYENARPYNEEDLKSCYDVYFAPTFFEIGHKCGHNYFRFDLAETVEPVMCQWRYFKRMDDSMDIIIDKGQIKQYIWRRPIVAWRELEGMAINPKRASLEKKRTRSFYERGRYTASQNDFWMKQAELYRSLDERDFDEYQEEED